MGTVIFYFIGVGAVFSLMGLLSSVILGREKEDELRERMV